MHNKKLWALLPLVCVVFSTSASSLNLPATTPAPPATCGSSYAEGTQIPAGCGQPAGTQPDTRPRDPATGQLVIPDQVMGMNIDQFAQLTCPSPCSLTEQQLQSNFASFGAYQQGGPMDPSIWGAGQGAGGGDAATGGNTSANGGSAPGGSCGSGGGVGPLASMFGGNITQAVANQLSASGLVPSEYANILANPNSTAEQVALAMAELKKRGLPTNPFELAQNSLPILDPNGGGIIDRALAEAGRRGASPEVLNALNFAKTQALSNNNLLTEAASKALRLAGIDPTVSGLAQEFGIPIDTSSIDNLAGVEQLLPSELQDIQDALEIAGELGDLDLSNITVDEFEFGMNDAAAVCRSLAGGDCSNQDVQNLFESLGNIERSASSGENASGLTVEESDEAISMIFNELGDLEGASDLTLDDVVGVYYELDESEAVSGSQMNASLGQMENIRNALGSPDVSSVLTSLQGIARLNGGAVATQNMGSVLDFASRSENVVNIKNVLGPDYQTKLANLKAIGGIQNLQLNSISGAFTAAQKLIGSGSIRTTNLNVIGTKLSGLGSKFQNSKFAQKLGPNLSSFGTALSRVSSIAKIGGQSIKDLKGFSTKLKSINMLNKMGFDNFGKAIKSPEALKKWSNFGSDKMKSALNKIKNFGPAQMSKLFNKLPNLDVSKINKFLGKGTQGISDTLNKIPGASTLLGPLGGVRGAMGLLQGVNFTNAGCLFKSVLNRVVCDADPPTCGSAAPPNAVSGPGQDDTYKNYCFTGPIKPRPAIQIDEDNPESGLREVSFIEPDYDTGMDGAKSNKGCIKHKDTKNISILDLNGEWLLKEHSLDLPKLKDQYVINQSPYYVNSQNEYKLKGALVNERGGVNSTTVGDSESGAPINLRCDNMIPRCRPGDVGYRNEAVLARLNYDSCTNKFILNNMLGFGNQVGGEGDARTDGLDFIFDPSSPRGEMNYDQTFCQPFKMVPTECEPDLLTLRGALGSIANGVAASFVQGQMERLPGGRTNRLTNQLREQLTGTVASGVGNAANDVIGREGACVKKTCNRVDFLTGKKNCTKDSADKYDYEAWRYLQRAWFRTLDLSFAPAIDDKFSMLRAGNEDALNKLREKQNLSMTNPDVGKLGGFLDEGWKKLGDGMAPDSWGNVDVQLNGLIKHPYERIWDPTHPFSPRYHYSGNDRDTYSGGTAAYFEYTPCEVRCAAVKVDIMDFRKDQFDNCMTCRISVNTACFWSEVVAQTICPGPCIPLPVAVANSIAGTSPVPVCATPLKKTKKWPPCNTKYDKNGGKDNMPGMCYACVLLSGTSEFGNGVQKCCSDLAKPLAPVNTLKIRTKKRDMPEGYTFAEYFDDHKPYMRWWDTGGEAGKPGGHDQRCNLGARDTIIGVGTEDRSCRYGGGKGLGTDCIKVRGVDPISSWMELKLYQTRAYWLHSLNCLPQYEKLYKSNSAEDFVLAAIGKNFNAMDEKGQTNVRSWPESWRGYVGDTDESIRFPKQFKGAGFANAISKPYGNLPQGLDNAKEGDILIWDDKVTPGRMPGVAVVVVAHTRKNDPTVQEKEQYVTIREMNAGKYPDACGNTDAWGIAGERTLNKHCIVSDGVKPLNNPDAASQGVEETSMVEAFLGIGKVDVTPAGKCFVPKKDDEMKSFSFNCGADVNLKNCREMDWNKIVIYRPCLAGTNNDCRD